MKNVLKQCNTISRREIISLLASAGVFGLAGLNTFSNDKEIATNKPLNKMKNSANNTSLKTIGILGGLGPQATMDLEMRIHKVAQELLPPAQNSGYPPMVVQYYRHAPIVLTDDHQPVIPLQVDERLLDVANKLGREADFILLPSNGIHLFQKEIEQASGRKMISMIDATMDEVKKRRWGKVGVLGLMSPKVYTTRLQDAGIAFETIDNDLQEKLNLAIFKVMEGREDNKDRVIAARAVQQLRVKNVDGIIPGCTELPFLLGQIMNDTDILNPVQLLAEAAVKFAII